MWGELPNSVRIERSRGLVLRARTTLADWLAERRKDDVAGQYKTQLGTLQAVLDGALQKIEAEIGPSTGTTEEVHARGVVSDKRTALVARAFDFYQVKVDQRSDPRLRPLLAAADEVAWSLYTPPFVALERSIPAAPLPYIEDVYAPRMLPRADLPSDLRPSDELLKRFLTTLPVPLVTLPMAAVLEPWLLTAMGHEIGHHVQYDLLDDYGLLDTFEDLLFAKTKQAGLDAASFRAWSKEIFADAYSAVLLGVSSHVPLVAFEGPGVRAAASSADARYPPGRLRSALIAAMTREVGAEPGPLEQALVAHEQRAAIETLARALLREPLTDGLSLVELCGVGEGEHGADGRISQRAEGLERPNAAKPETTRSGARRYLAAAATAWWQLSLLKEDPASARKLDELRAATFSLLAKSREEGTRAAPSPPPTSTKALVDELWGVLVQAGQ